jgi:A/G-specific adenine glycosylase
MREVPGTSWADVPPERAARRRARPLGGRWKVCPGDVIHGFTHRELTLVVETRRCRASELAGKDGTWWPIAELDRAGLPTVMRKVIRHALGAGTR